MFGRQNKQKLKKDKFSNPLKWEREDRSSISGHFAPEAYSIKLDVWSYKSISEI